MRIPEQLYRQRPLHLAIAALVAASFVLYAINIHVILYTTVSILPEHSEDVLFANITLAVPIKTIYEPGHINVNSSFNLCPDLGKNLQLFIVIVSGPWNESARMDIRQTWGHFATSRRDVSVGFILGSTLNAGFRDNNDKEQYMYKDIIRGNFLDDYANLTLKTISILEWVKNYCFKAAFVLKTDDNTFINIPSLYRFISKLDSGRRVIYGRLQNKSKPIRNERSKYYISKQEYKDDIFPEYTTGVSYLFPARLSKDLYFAALNHTYLRFEDVFLTGIVANYLKIERIHAPGFHMERERQKHRPPLTLCQFQRGFSIHLALEKGEKHWNLWNRLSKEKSANLGDFTDCKENVEPYFR